jgi:ABC-type dipeptide/oligopeptide/nickel transport system ATPase subunit
VAEPLQRFLGVSRSEQTDRVVGVLEDVALGSGLLSRYPDQLSAGGVVVGCDRPGPGG